MNDKNKNPNLIKNGGDGTAVGKMLRWMGANGKAIAPTILELAGTVTGIEGLKDLGNILKNETDILNTIITENSGKIQHLEKHESEIEALKDLGNVLKNETENLNTNNIAS